MHCPHLMSRSNYLGNTLFDKEPRISVKAEFLYRRKPGGKENKEVLGIK